MKRVFSLGLVFVMVLSLFTVSFASSNTDWIGEEAENTNEKIELRIDNGKSVTNREIGGVTILSSPPRIVDW